MRTSIVVALVIVSVWATAASASPRDQPASVQTVYELVLNDGTRAYGQVETESDTEVVFRTTSGDAVSASKKRIVSLRPVRGRVIRGEFRRDDPNNTRLAFGPTARAVPRGEAYLGVYQGIAPFVQVGLTDRLSIGGGTPLIFGFSDWDRPYWITPKLQVYAGQSTTAAVGLFHGFSGDANAGVAYGVLTKDNPGGSFTLGAGLGYNSEGGTSAVAMVGGELPARRNIKWITENYAFKGTFVTSGGVRFFGERLAADLVIGVAIVDEGTFPFPVVNFVYRF
jgi:hypothetical protein